MQLLETLNNVISCIRYEKHNTELLQKCALTIQFTFQTLCSSILLNITHESAAQFQFFSSPVAIKYYQREVIIEKVNTYKTNIERVYSEDVDKCMKLDNH